MGMRDIAFDNSYVRDLQGMYLPWQGADAPAPQVLRVNRALADELGLDADELSGPEGAAMLTGAKLPKGAASIAMAYAGHQFGGFSPQLGDGRALLVGEVLDRAGRRRDIHLKGSGQTPFSRGGDGKAVLGPVLREYLIGEAMHALGIPTTRALAASVTGETVMRDGPEQGAVLARVAASHLRVGTFEFFAARREVEKLRALADYAIARHCPAIGDGPGRHLDLFRAVRDAQAALVAQWVSVGFVHGVMNTDNMTISGETIDYGPCAFIDGYDPAAVFSSIDRKGRYAYGNQPNIAQWNLARFAEALIALVGPDEPDGAARELGAALAEFPALYQQAWLDRMRAKLGLAVALRGDLDLVNDLHGLMQAQRADFTRVFRALADVVRGEDGAFRAAFADGEAVGPWLERYVARQADEGVAAEARAVAMDRVNPVYVPRNHMVEAALAAANAGDLAPFDALLDALRDPFDPRDGMDGLAGPAPEDFGPYTTFCGT